MSQRCILNLYFGADQNAFINWIKSGSGYGPGGDSYDNLNQYGCPIAAPSAFDLGFNTYRMQLDLASSATYSGHWVLKFPPGSTEGFKLTSADSTLTTVNTTGVVTGSGTSTISLTGTGARLEFSTTTTSGVGWYGQFLGGSTVYSNAKGPVLVRLSDEAAYDAGELFNPDFIAQILAINPLALRMMQWSGTSTFDQNSSMPFTNMPSLDYITWGVGDNSFHYSTACYVGTIGGTDTYTCAAAPGTPGAITAGETFWGVVTNTNTLTTATLNINGRGAKKLLHHDGSAIQVATIDSGTTNATTAAGNAVLHFASTPNGVAVGQSIKNTTSPSVIPTGTTVLSFTGTTVTMSANATGAGVGGTNTINFNTGELIAGSIATFVYEPICDGYFYSNSAMETGVPISVMVALCNKLGCGLHYTVNALTPDSEITATVQYFRDNLNGTLFLEYGNELFGGVPQPAAIGNNWANLDGTGPAQVYGYRIRRTMGLATAAWAPRSMSSLRRVMAWQPFGDLAALNTVCLQGQTYAKMTALGWDIAPNRPVDFLDILEFAPYYQGPSTPAFQGGYTGTTTGVQAALYAAADNYASGNTALKDQALDWVDFDIRQGVGGNGDFQTLLSLRAGPIVVNGQAGAYNGWEALAASYDVSRPTNKLQVGNYEGGLQINPPTTGTLTGLGIDTAYSAKITNLFNAYKNDVRCKRLVFDQMSQFMRNPHSYAPCWYAFCGDLSQWSTHSSDLYSPKFKSYDALVQFNDPTNRGHSNLVGGF